MAIPLIIGAAIVAGAGIAKAISGARQASRGRAIERSNVRPDYDISEEYFENRDIAAEMAQSGLGADALNFYRTGAERGLTSSLSAVLQAGGGPNSVAGLYDAYQQGIGGIAAADAQAETNNIRYFLDRNTDVATQRTMQWTLDEYEPYKDRARLASELQRQGTENVFSGISQVGGAVSSFGKAGNFSSLGGANAGGLSSTETITNVRPNATVVSTAPGATTTFNERFFNNALGGMDNSPYRDLVNERMRRGYTAYNPAYFQ